MQNVTEWKKTQSLRVLLLLSVLESLCLWAAARVKKDKGINLVFLNNHNSGTEHGLCCCFISSVSVVKYETCPRCSGLIMSCTFLQGPAAGNLAAEPPKLAALLLRLQPPPVLALHPGRGAGHPALHPAPAEDPPAGAEASGGPEPSLGRGGRGPAALRPCFVFICCNWTTKANLKNVSTWADGEPGRYSPAGSVNNASCPVRIYVKT